MKASPTGSPKPLTSKTFSPVNVLEAAGVMGFATLLSRLMGLIREQIFAFLFGAGNLTDAYNVAFRIPNLLRDLFAEGAMSASLVPTFTDTRVKEGDRHGWRVAGLVFRSLFLIVSLLAIFGIIFAPQLVNLYASAFKLVPGKFELTVHLTRIMFPYFPLVALAAAFMGILNACGIFFLPAFASALFNIASVISGLALAEYFLAHPHYKIEPIVGMALGVVIGGAVQAFCQLPSLYRQGYRWQKKIFSDPPGWKDPRLRRMVWLMVPGTIGLAATQINILTNTILATSQGPGAVSWLNYAFRLMQFPIGVFGVSLASATLSRVSFLNAKQDFRGMSQTIAHSLKSVFAVNLPASVGLAVLSYPIIEMIFQYGHFYTEDTRATAHALVMYTIGLTAYSSVKVLVPICYALGNTRLPVISSLLAVILTIVLNVLMVKPFGFWGLALGTSLAAIFNAAFLVASVKKLLEEKGGQLPYIPLIRSFAAYLVLSLTMGGVCWFSHDPLQVLFPEFLFYPWCGRFGFFLSRCIKVVLMMSEGVIWIMVMAWIFRLSETKDAMHIFVRKFKNKLRRGST